MRPSERDYLSTILTAGHVLAGGHKPEHLQIHGPKQIVEVPIAPYLKGMSEDLIHRSAWKF
jgi:hypothetical protein